MGAQPWPGLRDPLATLGAEGVEWCQGEIADGPWLWDPIVSNLRETGLFHVTDLTAWRSIVAEGRIRPSGEVRAVSSATPPECAGRVCLFDLESADLLVVASAWLSFTTVLTRTKAPLVFVHFEDRDLLPGSIEYWEPGMDTTLMRVPYLECRHSGPVPLDAATAVHVVSLDDEQWTTFPQGEFDRIVP